MIELSDITKYYGRHLAADHISFTVEDNEVVGLLGPNGAGKTTTMRIITGFLPPSSGTAKVAGFDVMDNPLEMKKRIGYLPEQPPLYHEMRVRDYLMFVAGLKLIPKARRKSAVEQAMERCGLTDRAKQRIEHLSKGYRQRVGIAQAIVHEPQLVILDEPTVGLDPQQVLGVRALVQELAEKMTVLVSSHILSEIEATCGRVIIINRGKVVAVDTPAELRDRLSEGADQTVWLEAGGPIDAIIKSVMNIETITDVEEVERGDQRAMCRITCEAGADPRNAIASCVLDAGGQLLSLRKEQTSLEQVFIRLTEGQKV